MEDCRIAKQVAEWNPQGKRRRSRPVSTWKDGIKDSVQRRNLKDEECFAREVLKKKSCLWLRKTVHSKKIPKYIYIYVHKHQALFSNV
jgi:hypothetical protein